VRLVFHVGLHRAASTSFQRWLKEGSEALARQRIFAAPGLSGADNESPFACLIGKRFEDLGARAAAQSVERELAHLAQDFDIVVVSEENLLGMMAGRSPRAFEARGRLAELFALLREKHEVVPVLILREQAAWLNSCYHVHQMRGGLKDFENFVNDIDPASLEFAPLLEQLAAASSGGPVVGTLDAIAKDGGSGFLARLAEVLGTDAGLPQTLPVKNVSPQPLTRTLIQEAARLGAALTLAGTGPLVRKIAATRARANRYSAEDFEELSRLVASRWVEMPEMIDGPLRWRAAHAILAEKGPLPLSAITLEKAKLAMENALASLDRPLAPPRFLAALAERYAADRRLVAQRYAPQWLDEEETTA